MFIKLKRAATSVLVVRTVKNVNQIAAVAVIINETKRLSNRKSLFVYII